MMCSRQPMIRPRERICEGTIAGMVIPDSAMVREATDLIHTATVGLLFDHCRPAYSFGMPQSHQLQPPAVAGPPAVGVRDNEIRILESWLLM